MSEESIVVFLKAQIGEFKAKMGEAGGELEKFGSKSGGTFGKFQQFSTGALLAVGAAAVAVGAYGVKMADEYEKAHARLEVAVKNSGGDFEALKGKVGQTDKAMESLGFTNADTESSIATLTGATHDAQKAMSLQSLAADIARGRHIDLAAATNILVKVETGHVGLLGKLGINTKDATGKTIDATTAVKRLTDLYGGNAKAYTETFAGKIEVLKTKGEDLAKNIGMALIPVIEQLVTIGMGAVTWLQDANDATGGWLGKLALFTAGGILAVGAITKIASAAASVVTFATEAAGAIARFSVEIIGFLAANPEIAVMVGLLALGVAAWKLFGDGAHTAKIKIDELTNTQLDTTMQNLIDKVDEFNKHSFGKHLDTDKMALDGFNEALKQGLPQAQRYIDAMSRSGLATDQERKILAERTKAQAESRIAQEKSTAAVDKSTKSLTPNAAATKAAADAAKVAATAEKAHATALTDLGAVVGPVDEKIVKGMHLSTAAIKAMATEAKNMDSAVESAFDASGKAISDFKDKSHVAFSQFAADELKQLAATSHWSDNIIQLIHDGLSKGVVEELVKAGPSSAGAAQAILDNVKHGSIGIQNSIAAHTVTEKARLDTALHGMITGATSASTQISALKPHITVTVDTSQATYALQTLAGTLSSINKNVTYHVTGGPTMHAAGGVIGPGEWGTVGEVGTELAYGLPGGGVRIFPHGEQPKSFSTASTSAHASHAAPASSGGDTIQLTVIAMDSQDVERRVIPMLNDWARRNGKKWAVNA